MRNGLKDHSGRRRRSFSAIFVRYGRRVGSDSNRFEFALFNQVKDEAGRLVRDHVWIDMEERFAGIDLRVGDEVFLVARAIKYRKRNPAHALDSDEPETIECYTLGEVREIRAFSGPKIARQPQPASGQGGI